MSRKGVVVAVLTAWAFSLSPDALFAQQSKEEALLARVRELEKRVALLEQTVRKLEPQTDGPRPTEVEAKLVGTWAVAEADRKQARLTDLKFAKGQCIGFMTGPRGPVKFGADYALVGKQLAMTLPAGPAAGVPSPEDLPAKLDLRIISVSDAELVLEVAPGQNVRYHREK
jgi:hypothetical protein